MKKLVTELKRRNVMRVAVAYAIAGWVLMQIAATVLPIFEAPPWTLKVVTFLIVLGFPIALILAWAFEMTPEGIKREADVDRSDSITTQTGRKLDRAIIVVLLVGITWLAADKLLWTDGETRITEDKRSVAVIPFQNMSQDAANEPFTIGIHDDLLTQISRIGSIKTISRTSVLQYRDTTKTIPEIAAELGVATILEGGVQRAGSRVRINAQLIDAATDEHLWAETYDRELNATNIFAIQSEIALAIAKALRATLTVDEQQRLDNVPTRSIAALERYFVGKQMLEGRNTESLLAAIDYFQQVIKLDPDFALAYSGLADAYMLLPEYSAAVDPREIQENSEAATVKALSLDPDLPEVLTSMGWNRLIHDYDWAGAEEMLRRALEIQPNHSGALHWLSHVVSWQGKHEEALAVARKAVAVDPLSRLMKMNLAYIMVDAGDFGRGIPLARTTIERNPNFVSQMRNLTLHELRAGDVKNGAMGLETWASAEGRDVAAARDIGRLFVQHQQSGEPQEISDALVTRLELGSEDLAQVYAFVGDGESALQALEIAFEERSGSRSVLSMKINPAYDFIRDDPRFVELLQKLGLSE
jgi:serine/threonine-protein kinase